MSPALADGYHITFQWPVFFSQLFGFAVIVFVMMKWIVPVVRNMMARSQEAIARQVDESERATQRLTDAQVAYDDAVDEANTMIDNMRADAQTDAQRIVEQLRQTAADEVDRVRKQGREQVTLLRRQLIRDLEADLATALLAATEKKVRQEASQADTASAGIDRFLDELEALADASPGARRQALARWN